MKKTIVSVATALAIAVGSFGTIAATTSTASAETRVIIRTDNGVRVDHRRHRDYRRDYRKRQRHVEHCRVTVTKKVVWRNHKRHVVRVKERRCW